MLRRDGFVRHLVERTTHRDLLGLDVVPLQATDLRSAKTRFRGEQDHRFVSLVLALLEQLLDVGTRDGVEAAPRADTFELESAALDFTPVTYLMSVDMTAS